MPAGTPNQSKVCQCALRPISPVLKRLLRKWTMAVSIMATSAGKNKAKAGRRSVPSPKPEKKVSKEASKATITGKMISITEVRTYCPNLVTEALLRADI